MAETTECNDTRPCYLRDGITEGCRALSESYQNDGECPFCKAKPSDKGERLRVPNNQKYLKNLGQEYGIWK